MSDKDIELVIKIPEELYNHIMNDNVYFLEDGEKLHDIVKNGTPLPKGHGRLIDADAIPEQIELKGFLGQDSVHLVTIDRVKEALNNSPTIIEAESEGEI